MPRYAFMCEECKKKFEETLHITELEQAKVKCPNCGSDKVRQETADFFAVTGKKS